MLIGVVGTYRQPPSECAACRANRCFCAESYREAMKTQSSGELKGLHDEPESLHALWLVLALGFAGTGGILLLGRGGEEQAGVLGVADGGLGVEAEYRCQVQRVGSVGEGFLELPVDAEPFQGRGLAAEFGLGEVDRADWPGAHRRVLVDEQVRV